MEIWEAKYVLSFEFDNFFQNRDVFVNVGKNYFNLNNSAVIVDEIINCVKGWKDHFLEVGVSERDVGLLSGDIDRKMQ